MDFGHEAYNVLEDNPRHFVQTSFPVAFPRTEEEYKDWYSYCLIVFMCWLMAYLTMAIVSYQIQLFVVALILFIILLQGINCLGGGDSVYLTHIPDLLERIGSIIGNNLPTVSFNPDLIMKGIVWIYVTIYEIWLPISLLKTHKDHAPDSKSDEYQDTPNDEELLERRIYHIELRKEMALQATLLIIILNYGKITILLNYFHKCRYMNSYIGQIVKFLTNPILTLPYLCLLLYLEYYTNFLLNCWIMYTTLILMKDGFSSEDCKAVFFVLCAMASFQSIFWCSPLPFMSLLVYCICEACQP